MQMLDIKQLTRLQIIRYCEKLEKENKKLKADTEHTIKFNNKIIGELKLENDKLKVIIKNNDLEQKADWKHIEELEEEIGTLKDNAEFLHSCLDDRDKSIAILQEENKGLKADYIKLSKIVETTGGYKASYVNELRDKIAELEIYKKQYKHTMGEDYIDEDLYDLDC